jgi:hypothetical protein
MFVWFKYIWQLSKDIWSYDDTGIKVGDTVECIVRDRDQILLMGGYYIISKVYHLSSIRQTMFSVDRHPSSLFFHSYCFRKVR